MLFCRSRMKNQRWERPSTSSTVPAFRQNDDAGSPGRQTSLLLECNCARRKHETMIMICQNKSCARDKTSTWYLGGPSMSLSRKESASQYRMLSVDVVTKNQIP